MLVLERKLNQSIIIGRDFITIKVLGIDENAVSLGINAPPEFSIHREEVYDKILKNEIVTSKNPRKIDDVLDGILERHKKLSFKEGFFKALSLITTHQLELPLINGGNELDEFINSEEVQTLLNKCIEESKDE